MCCWIIKNILMLHSSQCSIIDCSIFRAFIALCLAFFIAIGIGPYIIKWLYSIHFLQIIRSHGPKSHIQKQGTPTMGGLIMLVSVIVSVLMCTDLSNKCVWYVLFILILYGILGLVDDFLKIKWGTIDGIGILHKYFYQSLIALILIVIIFATSSSKISTQLSVPFFKNLVFQLDMFWYVVWIYFTIVGTSNAVNLSDGLDGLSIMQIVLIAAGLGCVAWMTSNVYFANYLNLFYLDFAKELIIVCFVIVGSGLGFLWFNTYPAKIFMGDVGSLSFGGALGVVAILLRQECLLIIMGGVLVIETLSVILQVSCFKLFKCRIFKMAPIHHHFELQGCPEPRIVIRIWIVTLILVIFALVSLKI